MLEEWENPMNPSNPSNPSNPTNSITTKVFIENLPVGGDDKLERRVFSAKGEMAQILNRADQAFKPVKNVRRK